MKRQLACIACVVSAVGSLAQGTVVFDNSPSTSGPPGVGAPVFYIDGTTRLEGEAWLAGLYAGPDADSLLPWGDPLTFGTGASAGFFNTAGVDTVRSIGSVAPGAVAAVQVGVWEAAGGATYEAANAGGYIAFRSAIFTVVTGGAGSPPANLVGLTSFSLVPEPSTYALLALGAVALFVGRRGRSTALAECPWAQRGSGQ